MATSKVSITLDTGLLQAAKSLHDAGATLSAIVNLALEEHVHREEVVALLAELEEKHPISIEGQVAGEKLWQSMQSSSIPALSPPLEITTKPSGSRLKKRQRTARISTSQR